MSGAGPQRDLAVERCPLCGAGERRGYASFEQLEFVQCLGCELIYKSRERAGLLPADFYERGYFHGRPSGRERRFDHRARKAAAWALDAVECLDLAGGPVERVARLLEIGCSLGYGLEGARRLGLSAVGVDVSAYAVRLCRERGYQAHEGTLTALPFEGGRFDIVVLKHVLEHTAAPLAALAELRRVLSPRGVVLIAVPDARYWKGRWRRASYRYFRPDDLGAQHHVYYSARTLERLLTENGFRVRARSKAVYRALRAARSPWCWAWERLRHGALLGWVAVAGALRLQREVYLLASRAE